MQLLAYTLKSGILSKLGFLAFVFAISATNLNAAEQVPASKVEAIAAAALAKDIAILENRFFPRVYEHDPTEKRLERLECLVFGGTQEGDNVRRLLKLKEAIKAKANSQPSSQAPNDEGSNSASAAAKGKKADKPGQYPVLNSLEWRILKKTYLHESLNQRLTRLESRLFGQPSPSMAYVDRVERLKRTLGIGVTAKVSPSPAIPLGPMPRARSRTKMFPDFFEETPFSPFGDQALIPDALPGWTGTGFSPFLQDMRRQMQELQKLGPGSWRWDNDTGTWVEMETGRKVKPDYSARPDFGVPGFKTQPRLPQFPNKLKPAPLPDNPFGPVPSYMDPNSI